MIKRRLLNIVKIGIITFIVLAALLTILFCTKNVAASQGNKEKLYSSVMIEDGDTLWDISCKNHVEGTTVDSYIDELCSVNGISRSVTLKAGDYLTIYYYK